MCLLFLFTLSTKSDTLPFLFQIYLMLTFCDGYLFDASSSLCLHFPQWNFSFFMLMLSIFCTFFNNAFVGPFEITSLFPSCMWYL